MCEKSPPQPTAPQPDVDVEALIATVHAAVLGMVAELAIDILEACLIDDCGERLAAVRSVVEKHDAELRKGIN